MLGCMHALLLAAATTQLFDGHNHTAPECTAEKGQPTSAELILQHVAPTPAEWSPAAQRDAGKPADSTPASLPLMMYKTAQRGVLQSVAGWLRKGGSIDALCPYTTIISGEPAAFGLLHAAAANGHLELVRELLKRGASVDLPSGLGSTALMAAAHYGRSAVLLLLLQHSADPDLQDQKGTTALMSAAGKGHEACVDALLRAKANTELLNQYGRTALQHAEGYGHTAIAALIRRQHACLSRGLGHGLCATLCAVMPLASRPWAILLVMLGAVGAVALACTLRAGAEGQRRAARQRRPHRPAHAKAQGRANIAAPLPPSAPAPPPAAAPTPAASAAARAEAALRAAIAGGGLSALEAALAAAPRDVREGGVGAEARALRDRLLEAQEEAEREAKREAAAEAARLAAAERAGEAAARVAAASKAREEAVALAAALAVATAKADALERATAEGGGSGAAGPSKASVVAVPDQYICPITAEIMTDPVNTADGFTYERSAIEQWLENHNTSPKTGVELESKQLVPNYSLRSLIQDFHNPGA